MIFGFIVLFVVGVCTSFNGVVIIAKIQTSILIGVVRKISFSF